METTSPSEPEETRISRPLPCPDCLSAKGFSRVGKFRSQCSNCNALVANEAIGRDNLDPQ